MFVVWRSMGRLEFCCQSFEALFEAQLDFGGVGEDGVGGGEVFGFWAQRAKWA